MYFFSFHLTGWRTKTTKPPQLFQSAMDLDLSFDSGNINPHPWQDQFNLHHHQQQQPVIIKPPPPSSMSFQSVQQFYPAPMKPTKIEPPRLVITQCSARLFQSHLKPQHGSPVVLFVEIFFENTSCQVAAQRLE